MRYFSKMAFLCCVTLAFFTAAAGAQTVQPEVIIKVSTTVVRPNESYVLLDYMADRVAELTKGKVKIEVLQPFASEREMFEMVLMGQLQAQLSSTDAFSQWVKEARITALPMFYRSWDEVLKVLDGPVGDLIKQKGEPKGFKVVGFAIMSKRNCILSRKPIKKFEDFKGLKIRVLNSPIWINLYKAYGAIPVPMDWSDIYTSMQTGVLDGIDGGLLGSWDSKHYEVSKYATNFDQAFQVQALATSLKWWNALTPAYQQAIVQAMKEGLPKERQSFENRNQAIAKKWVEAGVELIVPDAAFLAQMRNAAASLRPEFAKAVGSEEVIKMAEKTLGR